MNVTCIINTFNEDLNIRNAIKSAKMLTEKVIVVDMYSNDNTVNIARDSGADVYFIENLGYVEPARAYACSLVKTEWVLILDADEILSIKLIEYIKETINDDVFDVVDIPRVNYIFGKKIKGGGWGVTQDSHKRLFKKNKVNFSNTIHSTFLHDKDLNLCKISDNSLNIIHFNYVDVFQFVTKMNKYTTVEALNHIKSYKRNLPLSWILISFKVFLHRYIYLKGFKDGWIGFSLCSLMGVYELLKNIKLAEMSHNSSNSVRAEYDRIAEKIFFDS